MWEQHQGEAYVCRGHGRGLTIRHDATAMKGLPIDLAAIWKAAEEKKGDGWFNMAAGSA